MNPAELFHIAAAEPTFWWYRGMRDILFDTLDRVTPHRPIARVLDAGCGTGATAAAAAARYGWNVLGLDISPVALQWLRRLPIPTLLADATALPLRPNSCDLVLSLDVLVHLEPGAESAAVSEFARILKPGGLLVLRVAAFSWLRSSHSAFITERQRFTRPQLLRLAAGNGFAPLSCTYLNCLALPLALAKFRLWEPLFQRQPVTGVTPLPPWLNSFLRTCLRLEQSWLRCGRTLPVGQTLLLIAERRS